MPVILTTQMAIPTAPASQATMSTIATPLSSRSRTRFHMVGSYAADRHASAHRQCRLRLCGYLALSVTTLYGWRGHRYGPPSYRIGNVVRYRPSEVRAWVDSHAMGS